MNFIRNLSIRGKLLLISLIPLLALLYFLSQDVYQGIQDKNRIELVYAEVQRAELISDLMHQVQQERGYSVGFVTSRGKEERSELMNQRQLTDRALQELNEMLGEQGVTDEQYGVLDVLPEIRNKVNALAVSSDSLRFAFTTLNKSLLQLIGRTAQLSENPEVKNHLHAHLYLLEGKEYFAQLRASLKQAILDGGFDLEAFANFASSTGKHEQSITGFRTLASAELLQYYDKKHQNPVSTRVQDILRAAYTDPRFERFNYSLDDWWVNGVSYLNLLKEVEDHSSMQGRLMAESKLQETTAELARNLLIALLLVALLSLLLLVTIRHIVSMLTQVKQAADQIAKGNLEVSVPSNSKDEIGDLARSFNELIAVSKAYAQAADEIGRGEYTAVVPVRSEQDKLGLSLNSMRQNLQTLSHDNAVRNWQLTGNSELNDLMRGDQDVRDLAQKIISQLTEYFGAQVGAIYLYERNELKLAGSYAFQHRKGNNNSFVLGEGLVGQAALEKKPIVFSDVPDNYVNIVSGLGHTRPATIMVYPFLHNGELKGVIEIGTSSELKAPQLELLKMVAENIGIAFSSSQSRAVLKELLEETQQQAEELEAQQEELRQINEELQEKTNLLEESEAELRAQQEELQQTNEELEEQANMLEEQKNRLELAKMEIETKARELEVTNKYKSEFLANMSHELRTPLNSILILAQLLSENKSGTLADKEREFANNIYSSGTDLLSLINEILDLSKVESGKIELELGQVRIDEIEENVQSLFREVATNRGISFETGVSPDAASQALITDKMRLEQIVRNLLSNAFKFTNKGGEVELQVYLTTPPRSLRNRKLRQFDSVMAFAVRDTGIGIPESKQQVVFEAFQQADGSTKRKYGGTGLGLSISRELANALGGELQLESEEGKGSTFTLYLPLVFDETVALPSEKGVTIKQSLEKVPAIYKAPPAAYPDAGQANDDRYKLSENDKIILIVEDDELFANILLEFVQDRGYKGIVAYQGNEGLSLARHYKPDAIILDMKLPVMDGSEVLKQLKNDPELRHIPVQVISGYDRRLEGFELGAFDFIKKPINKEDLSASFSRIEEFVNRKLKRLLIVEDNRQQNMAIRELMRDTEVKTYSAYTGEEAFALMQENAFDCVIIDLGLPDMGGLELLEKIKSHAMTNRVPIIVYTGKELSKDEASRLNKLANTVVLKTVDSTERLLDETVLFLHSVESKLPKEKQQIIRKLHRTDEVLLHKKVLIVDDDMRNIYSLTNALEEEGMQCITAENGFEAIQVLHGQHDVDIVLMDVMMPEMDGYEATREIRKLNGFTKLPIIALTAKAMKGDREKCLQAGMSDYVAKPVNVERLLSLMRVWLYQ